MTIKKSSLHEISTVLVGVSTRMATEVEVLHHSSHGLFLANMGQAENRSLKVRLFFFPSLNN